MCWSFSDAIERKSNFVMIPVENSYAGSVVPAYDELIKSNLKIKAEIILKIKHFLMGLDGIKISEVESVISYPQALSQCANSLKKLKFILLRRLLIQQELLSISLRKIKEIT